MARKEDLRIKKTKKALYDALLTLLSEKTFDAITINELCEVAKIRRATFYKHYSDKFAFMTAFTHALRDRFDSFIWKADEQTFESKYYIDYAKRIVGYISEHSDAIDNLLKSSLFPVMLAIILEQNFRDTKERLDVSVKKGMKLNASPEVVAAMCSGGVAATIYLWLRDGRNKDAEKLAEEIGAVIENTLK